MKRHFQVGDRVVIHGHHHWAGASGVITHMPGEIFHGWTVLLDNGYSTGPATVELRKV